MLAISRGLMSRPKLLLLDEPSLGLAPVLVNLIFETPPKTCFKASVSSPPTSGCDPHITAKNA